MFCWPSTQKVIIFWKCASQAEGAVPGTTPKAGRGKGPPPEQGSPPGWHKGKAPPPERPGAAGNGAAAVAAERDTDRGPRWYHTALTGISSTTPMAEEPGA